MAILSIFAKKSPSEGLEQKLAVIDRNIFNSFSAVKEDFRSIKRWIEHFDEIDKKHDIEIYELKGELRYLRTTLREVRDQQEELRSSRLHESPPRYYEAHQQKRQPIVEDIVEAEEFEIVPQVQTPVKVDMDQFTDTQKAIFSRLGIIQKESSQPWIPLKHLAHEVYPEKEYNDVRSTLSEYMGLLSDAGLIKRTRKGKQTFVSVSEKGKQLFADNRKKLKPKVK
ncbi:MAG: hypothetical protein Q8R00_03865 [Candidatus Nanoarchaeia archaeon]|nr:hypothetical protein [Candidatus Nanoarchaeia archaeon]